MTKAFKFNVEMNKKRDKTPRHIGKKHGHEGAPNAKHIDDIKHHMKETHRMDAHFDKTHLNPIPDELHGGRQKV